MTQLTGQEALDVPLPVVVVGVVVDAVVADCSHVTLVGADQLAAVGAIVGVQRIVATETHRIDAVDSCRLNRLTSTAGIGDVSSTVQRQSTFDADEMMTMPVTTFGFRTIVGEDDLHMDQNGQISVADVARVSE